MNKKHEMVFLNPHESIGLSIPDEMHLSVEKDRACPFPASCKDASPNGMPEKEGASYFLPKDASRDAGLPD
jgi:hypothetical protein